MTTEYWLLLLVAAVGFAFLAGRQMGASFTIKEFERQRVLKKKLEEAE